MPRLVRAISSEQCPCSASPYDRPINNLKLTTDDLHEWNDSKFEKKQIDAIKAAI